MEPVNGITLKSVRFQIEFKFGPGLSDSQLSLMHNRDDNSSFFGSSVWQFKAIDYKRRKRRQFLAAARKSVTGSKCSLGQSGRACKIKLPTWMSC